MRRRFLAPEIVQTADLDCGPAALKSLLEGFRIPVSYGRLREACQTGLDGTSIDTMETVANELGLEAEQILLPLDHLLVPEARTLPAIVVVQHPNGATHFVVIWRRHGKWLQIMDPSVGRRWLSESEFLRQVYRHTMAVPADDWLEWARGEEFQTVLRTRLDAIGATHAGPAFETWEELAALDAATRVCEALVRAGALKRGNTDAVMREFLKNSDKIPAQYWCVRPGDEGELLFSGAVLVRIKGRRATEHSGLADAVGIAEPSPGRILVRHLLDSGALKLSALLGAAVVSAGAVLLEALLFRSLFDVTADLQLRMQRLGAMVVIVAFCAILCALDYGLFSGALRFGRQLELRFRIAFLSKIPLLGDHFFQSRLTSDMAERSHAAHRLRNIAGFLQQLAAAVFKTIAIACGLFWLEPHAAGILSLIVLAALLPPFFAKQALAEQDLRVRSHAAGLTRFYLDAMLGLIPLRSHIGAGNLRFEHERLLGSWAAAALRIQKTTARLQALQSVAMFVLISLFFLLHPLTGRDIGRALLVLYWALNLPVLGQEIATLARQYPGYRSLIARLVEPLGAPEESVAEGPTQTAGAVSLTFRGVSACAAGHPILENIDAEIPAGAHVAIVGASGAGKSSLAGLLLGWLRAASGEILVDANALEAAALRAQTAWVDPAVQLWNRSLLENLTYGAPNAESDVGEAVNAAALRDVLEALPEGLQTTVGENGGLLSGGEGQRVRFARALLKHDARLVILDEPFRGLDQEKRHKLLARARQFWKPATLLCITHDISEAEKFDFVIVMDGGTIVEQGAPGELRRELGSHFNRLLGAEAQARATLWNSRVWRRIRVEQGAITEQAAREKADVA